MLLFQQFVLISMVAVKTNAWISSPTTTRTTTTSSSSSRLYNVPPPSSEDTVAYKEYASKQSPPSSFFELQQDCLNSVRSALKDGIKLMEVEFPPLPASVLELDDVSAYDVAQANLQLSLDFAKGLVNSEQDIKKIAIMLPDESEARIAIERATGNTNIRGPVTEVSPGVFVSSLRRGEDNDPNVSIVQVGFCLGSFVVCSTTQGLL
jgi:hypothetical protein